MSYEEVLSASFFGVLSAICSCTFVYVKISKKGSNHLSGVIHIYYMYIYIRCVSIYIYMGK